MKRALLVALLLAGDVLHEAHPEELDRMSKFRDVGATIEFSSGSGKPLGSVMKIGGTTYYIGADGTMLGTSTIIDGRRVFTTY